MNLQYKSTRNDNLTVTASQAILKGLSDDGGLFVPQQIPALDKSLEELMALADELGRGYFKQGLNCAECVLRTFMDIYEVDLPDEIICMATGFGGGIIEQGLYFYDRAVKPWEPRAIVLRFFPNDIQMGYSPAEIATALKGADPNATTEELIRHALRAMERPGLWNGAMARWNTVFVETPLDTFTPIKVVTDLIKPTHKPK